MASYNELNALIDAYINQNGVQAITGQILNGVLKAMVEQLGRGYAIMGAATPSTDPGTPDAPECYFASETGTYTDFDGLQVVPGELALLCYTPTDGWTKNTIYEGFQTVGATIDGNVGTPSVGVSYANGVLSFDFHNMKGNTGDPAGFGTIGATVDGNIGTPGVTVSESGPATAKNLTFAFTNLKGETGVTSVVATVDNTSGNPSCAVSLVGQQLTLAFSGLKGAQGDTGVSANYPIAIVNNLTTNDPASALSAAQGVVLEGEVSQLRQEVNGETTTETVITQYTNAGYIKVSDGQVTNESSTWIHSDFIKISDFVYMETIQGHASVAAFAFYSAPNFSSYVSGLNGTNASPYMTGGTVSAVQLANAVPPGASYVIFSTNNASYTLKVTTNVTVVTEGLSDKVVTLQTTVAGILSSEDIRVTPRMLHISFDDTISAFYDLIQNSRASIFDNAFFAALRNAHNTYGCVFSCYCFLEAEIGGNSFDLSQVGATYASEFSANSGWLRFGFHSRDNSTVYSSASAETAAADYAEFITDILAITGTPACVDSVTRLQGFGGAKAACQGMRDADLGIQGLLCSDYAETGGGSGGSNSGYYLSANEAIAVWKKGQIYDYTERLHFYMSALRMDNTTADNMAAYMAGFLTAARWEQTACLEMYGHEPQMYDVSTNAVASAYVSRLATIGNWAQTNGFTFGYQMDKIRAAF